MTTDDLDVSFEDFSDEATTVETQEEDDGNRFRDASTDGRSTANEQCPSCDNDTAYYEMKQIRSADESETRFFECTECGQKWREDDH